MRLIHFADLHLGVERYGRPLDDRPWSSRFQDFLDAFDALVQFAVEERVDAVIFAGDAYRDREPTQTQQREFAARIRRLSEAGIAVFLLVGNHDLPNAEGRAHALEIFRTLGVPRVYVGDAAWFEENGYRPRIVQTRSGPLQVAFLPWPQLSRFTAARPDLAALTQDQLFEHLERALYDAVADQVRHLDPNLPAVLAVHLSVRDQTLQERPGSEAWMMLGTAPVVQKSLLHAAAFDYVALGHHHNPVQLTGTEAPAWYSGSLQPVDFGEEGEQKGFVYVELDAGKPRGQRLRAGTPRFVPVPVRRFVTIDVWPEDVDPTPEVCRAVDARDVRDAIVRVRVFLDADQAANFRPFEVRQRLRDAHFIAGIQQVTPDRPREMAAVGQQLAHRSPLEVLQAYLQLKKVPEGRRERLLAAAKDLIASLEEDA